MTPPNPRRKSESIEDHRQPLPLDARGRMVARMCLTIALIVLALWLAADFLAPLGWAAIIAIATWPLYTRFATLFPSERWPSLPPLLFTLAAGAILFAPVALATHQITQQSETIVGALAQSRETGIPVPGWITQLPVAAEAAQQWWRENLADPRAASSWFQRINAETTLQWVKALGGEFLHRMFMFFISLIALFVLVRNGSWIAGRAIDTADRFFGDPAEQLARKMVEAVRGSVNGTVLVAVAEGLSIGIGYWLAGVPSWALFALLTIAFAMLPFGAWIAFTAAAVVLAVSGGSLWAALGVFGWGAAVMLVGDHFVWPTLVGGAARLPFLLALIGIFGGLQTFGLIGLFVGPVVMAALLTVWREWVIGPRQAKAA